MFKIELLRKQEVKGERHPSADDIGFAMNFAYESYEGYRANLIFNDVYAVHLDFKGDLSDVYYDLIKMVENLEDNKEEFNIFFLSSTFTAKWSFKRINKELISLMPLYTEAALTLLTDPLNYLDPRSFKTEIKLDKITFIFEFKRLLIMIREDLKSLGYGNELEGFDYLESLDLMS